MDYETRAGDRPERFLRGSLAWPVGGVILNEQHNRQAPIMRFTPQQAEGRVRIDAPLPDTQRGRDAATMIRDGTFTGLSVEFRAVRASSRGGLREVEAAQLVAAALVDIPSYPTSRVEVRDKRTGRRRGWL
ncbi:MAG: HK97 family phage prohead protease [Actinomycetia bacterium]|nr:HK97 family phage prohead protease [Actinomycetes bacterium]